MNYFQSLAAGTLLIATASGAFSAPPNDNFANRQLIRPSGGTVIGSNVDGSKEVGEPAHANEFARVGKSVWWTWTPAVTGTAVISTEGSSFDTLLAVYTGTSVGALTVRSADDNGAPSLTSRVIFGVTAGTAYQIAVDGMYAKSGDIRLTISHTIDVGASPGTGGTARGGGRYDSGTAVRVTAEAAPGYDFVNWTENGVPVSTAASYTFTVTGSRTLVARFTGVSTGRNTYGIKKLDLNRGELTFTETLGALSYAVEWSATMAPDSWSRGAPGVPLIPAIGPGDRTVIVGIIPPPCYYRVVAEMPPLVPEGFVLIPEGSFQMGSSGIFPPDDIDESPVRQVMVSAFSLQARETTKAEWDALRTWAVANGYSFDNRGSGKSPGHPVQTVSWYDAVKWCNARSQKEGLVPCYYTDTARTEVYTRGQVALTDAHVLWTANGYRLPTEAEWEKASRGGLDGRRFPWGATITHSLANYNSKPSAYDTSPTIGYHPRYAYGSFPYTSLVGSFAPNGYGLYDMAGNVGEWCWDWYEEGGFGYSGYSFSTEATYDPHGPSPGLMRVLRGGSWWNNAAICRVVDREKSDPSLGTNLTGFRPARRQ